MTAGAPPSGPALVSVIIPAFNAAATIIETLASVAAQTHRQLEILVIDDGSTDATAALVEAFGTHEPRLTLLRQANAGVAAARNAGLAHANGAYAAWLDADDLWHPAKVAQQLAVFAASATPLGLVYTGYRLIDMHGRIIPNFRTLADVSGNSFYRQIATTYFTNVSSIMVPTALARACGGHDPRLRGWGIEAAEDLLLQLQIAYRAPFGVCHDALVGYRLHDSNMSRAAGRAAFSNLKVMELVADMAPETPAWVFGLARARMTGFALQMLQAGDVGNATRLFWRLLRGQPAQTLMTLVLICGWMLRAWLGRRPLDPEVGQPFGGAAAASVPWEGHMLLTRHNRLRLDQADAARRIGRT